jgi:chromosome segregation ATPase
LTPAPSQFSFGGSTPSAGVSTPAGVNTPAGVETPAAVNSPAINHSENKSSTEIAIKVEPPPTTYQNQTVEEIINSLSQSLEKCSLQFLSQARRVASQDEILRISQNDIYDLSNQLSTLLVQQEELDQRLTQVGDVQNNLISELDTLEGQVDALFVRSVGALEGGNIDDADAERERYFSLAIENESRLTSLEDEIVIIEKDLQSLRDLNNDNINDDLGHILNTMNRHHDLLSALEGRCAKIESDMHLVSRSM